MHEGDSPQATPVAEGPWDPGAGADGAPPGSEPDRMFVAEILAALAYGERCAARRAARAVDLAPDPRARKEQQDVADRERQNTELIDARLRELGEESMALRFAPYYDAFFEHTEPEGWVEAQTFHYVGDALVSDFADVLIPVVDRVSGEIIRRTLGERQVQETFALDELTKAMEREPQVRERIRVYAQRIVGEAVTQAARAIEDTEGLRGLLGGSEAGKRLVLQILDGHRVRLDRLGIDPVDD
ncbi:MAG TPA: ferritin-like fold-containing protein [Actinomycetota bacterium]